jgi:hypothetical protein
VRILLAPSPLLGGTVYEPFVAALRSRGHQVVVADVTVGDASAEAFAAALAARAVGADLVVPHSNAGRFAARAAAAARASVVYVDALLPDSTVPADLAAFLRDLAADDGLLPPWTEWWPAAEVEAAVPASTLDLLWRTQPRVTLGFLLTDPAPVPRWREQSAAYLAFGETYATERAAAEAAGWPTRTLDGGHLHLVTAPDEVAAEVETFARGLAP